LKHFGRWMGCAAGLNLVWELAQLPLYTIYGEAHLPGLAYAVAHCTAGDVLIAAVSYGVATAVTRTWRWPVERPKIGLAAATVAAVSYTAFSEWRNVHVLGSWAYSDAMPLLFGIGLSPLLQWSVIPAAAVALARSFDRGQRRATRSA
jgi:hypothetical protein